jgi:hypothetical protein
MRLQLALLASIALIACKREEETVMPICQWEVAGDVAEESQAGALQAEQWFALLLKNFNLKTNMPSQPLKDCSGREIHPNVPAEQGQCTASEDDAPALPDRALVDDDLVVSPLEDGRTLVWVKSRHFDDGDALGPVAITEWTKRGIAVRTIGALRAHAHRARMRLEPMGQGKVLVVESDVCPKDNPKKCERVMRLVPMEGDRFVARPFVAEDGKCIGPAEFTLHEEQSFDRPDGTVRRFELTRNVNFTDGNVEMTETVVIKDLDPKQPDAPPTVFRNANVRRPIVNSKAGIVTKAGLWEPMLAEHGSVALQPATKKKPED